MAYRRRGTELLVDRNATKQWELEDEAPRGGGCGKLSGWMIGRNFVILHEYPADNGFDIYRSINDENSLAGVTAALDKLWK